MFNFNFPPFLIYLPEVHTSCLTHNMFPLSRHQPSSCFCCLPCFLSSTICFIHTASWAAHMAAKSWNNHHFVWTEAHTPYPKMMVGSADGVCHPLSDTCHQWPWLLNQSQCPQCVSAVCPIEPPGHLKRCTMQEHTVPSGWQSSGEKCVLAKGKEVHHSTQRMSVHKRQHTYRKWIITAVIVTRTPENYTIVDGSL
jgi:hypothetical protein